MSTPRDADDWESVETVQDFVELLRLLALDWDEDEAKRRHREEQGLWASEGESWASGSPGQWMEATHAWLSSEAGGGDREILEPSWRAFAGILCRGRRYE